MKYTFSEEIKTQRYGTDMYAIMEGEKIVAYSEVKFEMPGEVRFSGNNQAYIFKGAKIIGGNFWGGNFRGGNFRGGDFWGGDFWGGNFRGGNFRGGNFRGGDFWGGDFWGGNFRGGDFWGGNFRGGDYETTLLQIQGSRHFCYLEKTDKGGLLLGIGCHKKTIEEWKEAYNSIGEGEDYTQVEILEYKEYIDLYDRLYNQKNLPSQ